MPNTTSHESVPLIRTEKSEKKGLFTSLSSMQLVGAAGAAVASIGALGVLSHPDYGPEYVKWQLGRAFSEEAPAQALTPHAKLGLPPAQTRRISLNTGCSPLPPSIKYNNSGTIGATIVTKAMSNDFYFSASKPMYETTCGNYEVDVMISEGEQFGFYLHRVGDNTDEGTIADIGCGRPGDERCPARESPAPLSGLNCVEEYTFGGENFYNRVFSSNQTSFSWGTCLNECKNANTKGCPDQSITGPVTRTVVNELGRTYNTTNLAECNALNDDGWISTMHPNGIGCTKCGKFGSMIGGFNILGHNATVSKTFNNLGDHDYVRVVIELAVLDTWNDERFFFLADGKQVFQSDRINHMHQGEKVCGMQSANDHQVAYTFEFSHKNPNIELSIKTTLDALAYDESYGIQSIAVIPMKVSPVMPKPPKETPLSANYNTPTCHDDGWVSDAHTTIGCYECGGEIGTMLGGYKILGAKHIIKKNFVGLPTHTKLKVKLGLAAIDSWNSEVFKIYADGEQVYKSAPIKWQNSGKRVCGNPAANRAYWTDRKVSYEFEFPHSGSKVEIGISTNLGEDFYVGFTQNTENESFGLQQIDITLM